MDVFQSMWSSDVHSFAIRLAAPNHDPKLPTKKAPFHLQIETIYLMSLWRLIVIYHSLGSRGLYIG